MAHVKKMKEDRMITPTVVFANPQQRQIIEQFLKETSDGTSFIQFSSFIDSLGIE